MKIKNLAEAQAKLMAYVPARPQLTRKDTVLDRIRPLMRVLGDPQDRLRTVHIAGTSGKTSTAYYVAALLTAAGQKTGLTVSPHVDSLTERVQINGRPLSDAAFCRELGRFLTIVESSGLHPSYFELLYAFAIWVFDRQQVDYAVVETGVGGLHDATNVITRADKICAITDIGFDHMHLLGNTLPAIAAQKAGIIHAHNHVFTYQQADEIMTVIQQQANRQQAPLHIVGYTEDAALGDLPDYQKRNWTLAHAVYQYLAKRDKLPSLTSQALQKTRAIQVPGRMEIKQLADKTLVMDGAHNEQKMATFVASLRHRYPDAKPAILVALKKGKDYQAVVPVLAPLAARIITTTFNTTQDLPLVSMDAEELAEAFRQAGAAKVEAIPDHQAALQALLAGPEQLCIITGSFYLLSQIRNNT